MTFRETPETSSTCSLKVSPSLMSLNSTVPETSVMIGTEKGSHSAISSPCSTNSPSCLIKVAPIGSGRLSRSLSFSRSPNAFGFIVFSPSTITASPRRPRITIFPSRFLTSLRSSKRSTPLKLASHLFCSTDLLAVPPMWKVRMVS